MNRFYLKNELDNIVGKFVKFPECQTSFHYVYVETRSKVVTTDVRKLVSREVMTTCMKFVFTCKIFGMFEIVYNVTGGPNFDKLNTKTHLVKNELDTAIGTGHLVIVWNILINVLNEAI